MSMPQTPLGVAGDDRTMTSRPGRVFSEVRDRLRRAGLRPTRQRLALGWLLFSKGDRHVTADSLFEEAKASRIPLSLATVYNSLHQFTSANLLRQVSVNSGRSYFDTNVSSHHHFYCEDNNTLMDLHGLDVQPVALPTAPEGTEIVSVDVVVRLRRTDITGLPQGENPAPYA